MAEQTPPASPEENASWQYTPSNNSNAPFQMPPDNNPVSPAPPGSSGSVSWAASEYIEHQHGTGWYLMLIMATIVLSAFVYLLTKEYFAAGTITVVGIIVGVFAARKPQQVTYEINNSGLRVGQKMYTYNLFKSFAVIREGGLSSLNLLPLKRFMPPVSAYFDPANEEQIVSFLSNYLPYEEHRLDSVDRLSRRLRL